MNTLEILNPSKEEKEKKNKINIKQIFKDIKTKPKVSKPKSKTKK